MSTADNIVLISKNVLMLGNHATKELLGLGARVMLVSRTDQDVQNAVKELRQLYGDQNVFGLSADVSTREGIDSIMNAVRETFDNKLNVYELDTL